MTEKLEKFNLENINMTLKGCDEIELGIATDLEDFWWKYGIMIFTALESARDRMMENEQNTVVK